MRWPWQRSTPSIAEGGSKDAAPRQSPAGWAFLPPLVGAPAPAPLQLQADFVQRIPTRTVPTQLTSLGHLLSRDAPGATIGDPGTHPPGWLGRPDATELVLRSPTHHAAPPRRLPGAAGDEDPAVQRDAAVDAPTPALRDEEAGPPEDSPAAAAPTLGGQEPGLRVTPSPVLGDRRAAEGGSAAVASTAAPRVQRLSSEVAASARALLGVTGSTPADAPAPASTGSAAPSATPRQGEASPIERTMPAPSSGRSPASSPPAGPPSPRPRVASPLQRSAASPIAEPSASPDVSAPAPPWSAPPSAPIGAAEASTIEQGTPSEAAPVLADSGSQPSAAPEATVSPQRPVLGLGAPLRKPESPTLDRVPLQRSPAAGQAPSRPATGGEPALPRTSDSSETAAAHAHAADVATNDAPSLRAEKTPPSETSAAAEVVAPLLGVPLDKGSAQVAAAVDRSQPVVARATEPSRSSVTATASSAPPLVASRPSLPTAPTSSASSASSASTADGDEPAAPDSAVDAAPHADPAASTSDSERPLAPQQLPILPLLLQRHIESPIDAGPLRGASPATSAGGGTAPLVRAVVLPPEPPPPANTAASAPGSGANASAVDRPGPPSSRGDVAGVQLLGAEPADSARVSLVHPRAGAAPVLARADSGGLASAAATPTTTPTPLSLSLLALQRVEASTLSFPSAPAERGRTPHMLAAGAAHVTETDALDAVVQRALEAEPAGAAPPPMSTPAPAGAGPSDAASVAPGIADQPQQLEHLLDRLYAPLVRRLKAEMLLDRERRGVRIDRV